MFCTLVSDCSRRWHKVYATLQSQQEEGGLGAAAARVSEEVKHHFFVVVAIVSCLNQHSLRKRADQAGLSGSRSTSKLEILRDWGQQTPFSSVRVPSQTAQNMYLGFLASLSGPLFCR